jgi:branched-chain amino acid transport system ATP-binding protein
MTAAAILEVRDLAVSYRNAIVGLRGVTLEVPQGHIVALLGANGAGKTTLLRAVSGLLPIHHGQVTAGSVQLRGQDITGHDATAIVRSGVSQVMEGRRIFGPLSVEDNLRAGAFSLSSKTAARQNLDRVLELFPRLAERRSQVAGYLSGGEQQMLAIGRALMASPTLLLLDEPSLGLAPLIVEQIRNIVVDINQQGTSVLLVEQNAMMALSIANHAYIVETGRVMRHGPGADLLVDADIQEFYLGMGDAGRRSFRDTKTYRPAKRWSA